MQNKSERKNILAHQRITIDKKELRRYLKEKFLWRLGPEWRQNRDDMLTRHNNLVVQGLYFDRSSYGKRFIPNFFVQVLPMPLDHFAMQLGSRLRDKREAELWLDWDSSDEELVDVIWNTYQKQADPPLNEPLNMDATVRYLKASHGKSDHFHDQWSLGILYGYQGHLKDAGEQFALALRDLRKRASGWESKGKAPPEWVESNTSKISEFISKLETVEMFCSYCDEQAATTAKVLKLK